MRKNVIKREAVLDIDNLINSEIKDSDKQRFKSGQ
jgi:hypothetical protein